MKLNYKHLLLSTTTALLLTACGGNSTQTPAENPQTKQAKAQLGALSGATVEIHELGVTPYKLLFTETTSAGDTVEKTGNFDSHHTELDDEKFYLYTVSNGIDVDANDDGVIDAVPTINKGSFHAIVQGKSVKKVKGDFKVTVASELLYKKVKADINATEKLEVKLDSAAKEIFKDSEVTSEDILQYNPVEHKEVFKEEYQEQLPQIIKDIHDNKKEVVEKQAPSANAGGDRSIMIGSSVTLKASGVDIDGSIVTYNWSEDGNSLSNKQSFTYKPTTLGANTLTLTVTDNDNLTATDSILITVVDKPNTAPTAKEASYTLEEDTSKSITLEGDDIDSDALTYKVVVNPTYGRLSGDAPNLTYTPNDNYNGSDSFIFITNDGKADSKRTKITLTVTKVNDRPIINPRETIQTNEDSTKKFTLSATDTEGDTLTYTITTSPTNGTLTHKGAEFTYSPKANYNGSDSFGIKSNDGSSDSDEVTIMISVTAVNDAPTVDAGADASTTVGKTVRLTATASDIDGEIKSYRWFEGDRELSKTQTATYIPTTVGAHTLSVTVTDDKGATTTDRVLITATAKPNTTPIATAQSITMDEDTTKAIMISGTDADQDSLTYTIKTQPSKGKLTGTAPNLTYRPNKDYFGNDSFTFIANDGKDDSAPATVSIMIDDVEEPDVVYSIFGHYDTAGYAYAVALSKDGTKAYVADLNNGLVIVDISNPADPTLLGSYDTHGGAVDVVLSKDGTKAYVADKGDRYVQGDGLVVVDISNPTKPTLLGSYDTAGHAYGVTLSSDGTKAYVADDQNGLVVVDISNPAHPTLLGSYGTSGYTRDVALSNDGTKAYVADYQNGLVVVDISNPAYPTKLGAYNTAGYAIDVVLSNDGTKAYVADDSAGLVVVDISDPAYPTLFGSYDTTGQTRGVTLSNNGTKAYVADRNDGLVVVDISDPAYPTLLGSFDTAGLALGVTLSKDGTKAYVADFGNGLVVVDLEFYN